MLFRRLLRYQQNEEQINRATIRRVKRHRRCQAQERTNCLFQPLDSTVGNRHTLAQAGGTEFFACEQAIENDRSSKTKTILKKHARLFENPLLAAGFKIEQNLIG